jgi:cardiolipin synthase A/B
LQNCNLFFLYLVEQAQNRLWIASPYFVPNSSILNALRLAALRGVDVRIILPNLPDHLTVYFCSFAYYSELQSAGIKLYRYRPGFMHQKVILVDRDIAGVGTVNLDNRSFFLNFEVMTFSLDWQFIKNVEAMLQQDFNVSRPINLNSYQKKPYLV